MLLRRASAALYHYCFCVHLLLNRCILLGRASAALPLLLGDASAALPLLLGRASAALSLLLGRASVALPPLVGSTSAALQQLLRGAPDQTKLYSKVKHNTQNNC